MVLNNWVKIGEPRLLMSFCGRDRSSILPSNVESVAGDHDFHVVNFTPSVCLHVDIKSDEGQDIISYYIGKLQFTCSCCYCCYWCYCFCYCLCYCLSTYLVVVAGKAYVWLKDVIFQPSTPYGMPQSFWACARTRAPLALKWFTPTVVWTTTSASSCLNYLVGLLLFWAVAIRSSWGEQPLSKLDEPWWAGHAGSKSNAMQCKTVRWGWSLWTRTSRSTRRGVTIWVQSGRNYILLLRVRRSNNNKYIINSKKKQQQQC